MEDDALRGKDIEPGTDTYERASNVRRGETSFPAGERLSAKDALVLGELGRQTVTVADPFSTGLLATGTELHGGRQPDLDSPMLAALVRSWGHGARCEGTVPDERDRVLDRIVEVAERHDVVVTTGGTSVGTKDHAIAALAERGDVLFYRVAVRPGKPVAVARLPSHGAVAFANPGKPIGAHTIATLVARPFFVGEEPLATATASFARDVDVGPSGFEYVVPVSVSDGEAMPLGHADSALRVYEETYDPSVLTSSTRASRADGFVVTETGLAAGDDVAVVPYHPLE